MGLLPRHKWPGNPAPLSHLLVTPPRACLLLCLTCMDPRTGLPSWALKHRLPWGPESPGCVVPPSARAPSLPNTGSWPSPRISILPPEGRRMSGPCLLNQAAFSFLLVFELHYVGMSTVSARRLSLSRKQRIRFLPGSSRDELDSTKTVTEKRRGGIHMPIKCKKEEMFWENPLLILI